MGIKSGLAFFVLLAGVFVGMQSVFIVDQREQALLLQLGQPVGDIKEPGLHFKIPFIQNVRRFDRRILPVDPPPEQVVISSAGSALRPDSRAFEESEDEADNRVVSGEPIIVDTFARYRITDPLMFLKTLQTVDRAARRIENIMNDATRTVLGKTTLPDLLSEKRAGIMENIRKRVNKKIAEDQLGIDIVDVRIVRADLTPSLRQSTVRRMNSELKERATETRAKGEKRALEIRSTADKERSVILAKAERDAEIVRGEGDQAAIKIYAEAFNRDTEFYGFLRSLKAYESAFSKTGTTFVLSPENQFFHYFSKPGNAGK